MSTIRYPWDACQKYSSSPTTQKGSLDPSLFYKVAINMIKITCFPRADPETNCSFPERCQKHAYVYGTVGELDYRIVAHWWWWAWSRAGPIWWNKGVRNLVQVPRMKCAYGNSQSCTALQGHPTSFVIRWWKVFVASFWSLGLEAGWEDGGRWLRCWLCLL
jgi:hypothetical protein